MTKISPVGRLLLGHCATGVWQVSSFTNADSELAETLGYTVASIDLGTTPNKADLFQAISEALSLPDWFGHNWDALEESLAGWLHSDRPALLCITGLEALAATEPASAETLLDIMIESAAGQSVCCRRSVLAITDGSQRLPRVPSLPR